ncbi:GPI ethanolamine phosphate transferase 2, partial [Dufourea novaeangliae]
VDASIVVLFYVLFIAPLSIVLFLYGFFPLINYDNTIATENDIPTFIENVRIKTDTLYQPMVKRVILMVIDALRWDFITGSIGKVAMPITSSLIANSSACLFQTKVHPPTVTMPRIKAITTGVIPSFIDVALNFGSKPVTGDNVLLQAKKYGYKSVFYGDETWLTLFPSVFERYDSTTSFIVTDFTEVDNNITRHLHKELHTKTDWSIMVLHYLGLDHIGHVHGPFSPLIKTKLKEMDNVIARIQSRVQEWNQNNDSSLFIICGDHGMKDSGGHGGSTMSETTVPFIAISGKCVQNNSHFTEVAQVDIASTLSTILGVPIPYSNLGSVFLDSLYNLPVSKKLYVLFYNAKQVFNHFQQLTDYKSEYAYQKYMEAIKLHIAWLNTKDHTNDITDDIVLSYKAALKGMKELLISSMIKYDFHLITVAIFFLSHETVNKMGKWFFPLGAFVHAISFGGSSFVEEEHQTWYFYWATLLILLLYNTATKFYSHLQFYRNYKQYSNAQNCIKLLLLMIGHRILRKLNSTGDKYAHLPDIAGVLVEQESMLGMTVMLATALILLMWLDFIHEDKKYKKYSLMFNLLMCICIYLRHMHNNNVIKVPLYPQSRGIYEVQIFWMLLAMNSVHYIYRLVSMIKYNRGIFLQTTLFFILRMWIMVTAMLHQPYNVILLPLQIIVSSLTGSIIKDNNAFVYAWIGNVFYFYQGNSNSLATIDVAAGYVGIQSYMPIVNGSLLIINTYSAPVLAYLLLVYYSVLQYPYDTHVIIKQVSKTYITWRLLPITIYTIIISIQRHHLFVWSVFSPKLLYEAVYSTVICVVIIIVLILITLQNAINNCHR